ncbi:MAG: MFS transporter [Acidobacteria bacterium]|nr:MFS transporter [Acidobacteriota bacterium]
MPQNTQTGQPVGGGISSARRWTIVGMLCAGMMVAYFDRVNLSVVMVLPDFKQRFQLTDTDRGALNSAFFWSYAVLQIPAGWFVDRYGVKLPFAAALGLWSLVSAGTAFSGSVRQLFTLRLLLGVCESVVTPAGMRWIRFNCAENQRGLAVGLYMAAAKFGPAVGVQLATMLMLLYGWRNMFVILGLGCMAWLVPWLLLVRNDDQDLEKASVRQSSAPAVPFTRVIASPVIWGTVVGTFCYQYFVYYCMTWMPAYFVERRNLSLNSMGWYTMFSFTGMAVVAILAGFAADRMIDRGCDPVRVRKGFTIAGFLVASTELIGAMSDSNSVALFFAVFSLSGLGLMTANYWALTQTLIPGAAVGRVVGVQNCAANLPGIVAPLLTGWLKQTTGGYEAGTQVIWLFLILGIASYVFLVRPKYVPR